jgi:hypothetical protein
MVVEIFGYAYLVPFVEEEDHFFLKTIIEPPRESRRLVGVSGQLSEAGCPVSCRYEFASGSDGGI